MDYEEIRRKEGQRAVEWLATHWKGLKICPICGNSDWEVGIVSDFRAFQGLGFYLGGDGASTLPMFPVTCSVCGNTLMFSAIKSGVLDLNDYTQEDVESDV